VRTFVSDLHCIRPRHLITSGDGEKILAIIGSATFLVIALGFVAGLVPWWISHWRQNPAFFGLVVTRIAGGVLLCAGSVGLLDSFARFAVQGVGTPALVFPTRRLMITATISYGWCVEQELYGTKLGAL